jgi:hypothetical protein
MSNMRKKVLTVLAGAALALTGCAAEQPSPGCYVQDGTWMFKYANRAFGGNCTGTQKTTFDRYEAEQTGVFKFKEIGASGGSLVIRPRRAGTYGNQADPVTHEFVNNEKANAVGTLPDEPTGEGFERYCNVGDMSPIDVPSATTAGASRKYTFTNVKVYAGARSLGTQLSGRVHMEDITSAGTCTMDADVYAVWPAVFCDPAAMGNASADPHTNCGLGSLMNQDIEYACVDSFHAISGSNPATTRCVVANPTPSFKPGVEEYDYAD